MRKQGIEWIKNINSNVKVDLKNETEIEANQEFSTYIQIEPDNEMLSNKYNHYAYDKDFCLFVDFPFEQLIFFITPIWEDKLIHKSHIPYACTELWLFQYFKDTKQAYSYSRRTKKLNASNFTACDFDHRVSLCKKTNFQANKLSHSAEALTAYDYLQIFQTVSLILRSVIGALGIVTNLISCYVIVHNIHMEFMRDKHYMYMVLHCVSNIIICLIELVILMNECEYPFSFFCSSIRKFVAIQYVKIIFGEFLDNTCRLVSNFTFFAFSLCRMSKVGKKHDKFTVFISDLSVKKYMSAVILLSGSMSVCKALEFKINSDYPEFTYPISFFQNPHLSGWQYTSVYIFIAVINVLHNLINYFIFVIVHLIVDIVLVTRLWRVIKEKEEKMTKYSEKTQKENEESKRRVILMVILNSTVNLCTKIPLMITSMNDLRMIIQKPYSYIGDFDYKEYFNLFYELDQFITSFSFKYYCSSRQSCLLFQKFGNCLFLFSLSIIFYFLKYFDKNFKTAYDLIFNKIEK